MKEGYVYVAQFDDRAIKVGRSENPLGRLDRHRIEGAKYGRIVIAFWSSDMCDAIPTERALRKWCTDHGCLRPGTREYFTDVTFSRCVAVAETLSGEGGPQRVSTSEQEIKALRSQLADARKALRDRPMGVCTQRHPVRSAPALPVREPRQDPAERVLAALLSAPTIGGLLTATGMSRPTLYRYLKIIEAQGKAYTPERGVWRLVSHPSVEDLH